MSISKSLKRRRKDQTFVKSNNNRYTNTKKLGKGIRNKYSGSELWSVLFINKKAEFKLLRKKPNNAQKITFY